MAAVREYCDERTRVHRGLRPRDVRGTAAHPIGSTGDFAIGSITVFPSQGERRQGTPCARSRPSAGPMARRVRQCVDMLERRSVKECRASTASAHPVRVKRAIECCAERSVAELKPAEGVPKACRMRTSRSTRPPRAALCVVDHADRDRVV
jgi:hypothetical protein